ncbi:MAG: hypothetical protein K2X81_13360 [Candidatus Obscuribacterales bacterium]|nr:hypothetical protein [Candidatus Obscuribacterales bacterium]
MPKSKDKREIDEDQERPDSKEGHEKRPPVEHETKDRDGEKHLKQLNKEHEKDLKERQKHLNQLNKQANFELSQEKKIDDTWKSQRNKVIRGRASQSNMREISSIGQWQGLGRDVGDFLGGRQHGFDRASTGDMDRGGGGFTDMGRGGDGRGR